MTIKHFDIDSLIDRQVTYLVESKASIAKSASVDSASDKSTHTPDSIGWVKELAVFRHLDLINKPIYADAYTVLNDVKDENSNLTIRILNAKTNIPVKQVKFFYQDNSKKIRKIEASINEQNALYYTARIFSMEFDDNKDQMIISRFHIQGIQKMILKDSVNFFISSKINY